MLRLYGYHWLSFKYKLQAWFLYTLYELDNILVKRNKRWIITESSGIKAEVFARSVDEVYIIYPMSLSAAEIRLVGSFDRKALLQLGG